VDPKDWTVLARSLSGSRRLRWSAFLPPCQSRPRGGRPNVTGDPSVSNPNIDRWLNRDAFAAIQPFTFGNSPRNLPRTRTDGLQTIDLSVLKNFRFAERYTIQFRTEFFNLTNTPTFGNPAGNITSGAFGTIRSLATNTGPRNIQLALKFFF